MGGINPESFRMNPKPPSQQSNFMIAIQLTALTFNSQINNIITNTHINENNIKIYLSNNSPHNLGTPNNIHSMGIFNQEVLANPPSMRITPPFNRLCSSIRHKTNRIMATFTKTPKTAIHLCQRETQTRKKPHSNASILNN